MASVNAISRYRSSRQVIDEENLRDRVTIYSTSYEPINYEDRPDNIQYQIREGDRADNLATFFYGDPRLYWIILDFQPNPVMDALNLVPGTILIIPSLEFLMSRIMRS